MAAKATPPAAKVHEIRFLRADLEAQGVDCSMVPVATEKSSAEVTNYAHKTLKAMSDQHQLAADARNFCMASCSAFRTLSDELKNMKP